jgi:hypothetical protein
VQAASASRNRRRARGLRIDNVDGMTDSSARPIDGNAWSEYIDTGRVHFNRVHRSWNVFWRNANEMVGLLRSVEADAVSSLRLMQEPSAGDQELTEFHREFWQALDQRLHNLLSSATSVIDHTRPLVAFYEHEPDFQAEFQDRNGRVASSPRATFLRRLRNYLLHYGVAPLMQTLRLGPTTAQEWDHLRVQLSGIRLLVWDGWNREQREFIGSFDNGPPLREICVQYAEDMRELYMWLFEQHARLHVPGVPPRHLTEGRADRVEFQARRE